MSNGKIISKITIVSIIIGIIFSTVSFAAKHKDWGQDPKVDEVNVGDTFSGMYWGTISNHKDMFCVDMHQDIGNGKKYTAISRISIVGNTATDQKGKSITSKENGIIAYELNLTNKVGGLHRELFGNPSDPAQILMYHDMADWVNKVGYKFSGIYKSFAQQAEHEKYKNYAAEREKAKKYAESLEKEEFKNKTKEKKIKTTVYEKDNKSYIKIGPFKYSFRENLDKVELSDENGKTLKPTSYLMNKKEVELKDIKSNKNFYIIIPADSGLASINKIKVTETHKVKSADIVFWECEQNSKNIVKRQNLIQFKATEKPEENVNDWDVNIPLLGNLKIIKEDTSDGKAIKGVSFKVLNAEGKYVKSAKGKISYVDEKDATEFVTDDKGEVVIEKLKVGKYTIKEIKNPYKAYSSGDQDTLEIYYSLSADGKKKLAKSEGIAVNVKANSTSTTDLYIYNKKKYIDLSGFVWEDKLGGVKEISYATYGDGIFAKINENEGDEKLGEITVRLIDKDGKIVKETKTNSEDDNTNGIKKGEYKFTNVLIDKLADYSIEFEYDGLKYTSVTPKAIMDKDEYNNKYEPDIADINEVNSKAAEIVQQRKDLNSAFTEITNNGDITDETHGQSKNGNGETTGTITYKKDKDNHISTFESTTYNKNITANTTVTSFKLNEQTPVTNDDGSVEIKYLNLGLKSRDIPNIAIGSDLSRVEVQVNGYGTRYEKDSKGKKYGAYPDIPNMDVKFGNKYTDQYTREIYPSDIAFSETAAEDNKLKVYAVYTLTIANNSNTLDVTVPEILNYYDSNYTIVKDGTLFPEGVVLNGIKITELNGNKYEKVLTYTPEMNVGSYQTAKIKTYNNSDKKDLPIIESSNNLKIEITYQVSDTAIKELLISNNKTLNSVSEIGSYSTYYGKNTNKEYPGCENQIYAGIDENSAPGNAKPGQIETYEDDTDFAPSFVLDAKGVRQIEGTVFEDNTTVEGNERKGNGKYDVETENRVKNVEVKLLKVIEKEENGTVSYITSDATYYPEIVDDNGEYKIENNKAGTNAALQTTNDGHYIFKGVEPDDYFIQYTYENGKTKLCKPNGEELDDKVTVQDYKSTIITSPIMKDIFTTIDSNDAEKIKKNNDKWYKEEADARYSDARDDYTTRELIDEELKKLDASTEFSYKSLFAKTPKFHIPVEYESITTDVSTNKFIHKISNIDFGIVERPKQNAKLDKHVRYIKVTLPNGQVLTEGDVDIEKGIKPEYVSILPDKRLKIEIDPELLYGSHVEIKYDFTLENASEFDYRNASYYYYGESHDNPVEFTSATLIDFVDSDIVFKAGQEGKWDVLDMVNKGFNWNLTQEQEEQILKNYSTLVKAKPIKENESIAAGEKITTDIEVEKLLSKEDSELTYENNGEIVEIGKTGGRTMTTSLGDYASRVLLASNLETVELESDEAKAEPVFIMPPTGSTDNTVTYAIIGAVSMAVLGAGIFGIRKFLKK